jgi:predicted small lipoprotein YifL
MSTPLAMILVAASMILATCGKQGDLERPAAFGQAKPAEALSR